MSTESGGAPGRQGPRGRWSSRAGFILATAGFSVGLGNIWRFPYLVGENGGGAFLVVYVAIAILIGIPLITAELSLGRKSRLTPIAGMARLTAGPDHRLCGAYRAAHGLTGSSVLAALGQAFFSIGIGMATAFGLGSYLDANESDVPGNAAMVVAFDAGVAVMAGFVLFPALFAFGMDPDQGAGLLFVTMTSLFQQMPGGAVFGAAFFFLLLVAGFTSQVAVFEILVASAGDSLRMPRPRAVALCAAGSLLICVPVILSEGPWADIRIPGMGLFDFANQVSGSYMLGAVGLLISLYVVSKWGWTRFREETNQGAGRIRVSAAWRPFVRFIIPVAVALVLLGGFGAGAGDPPLFFGCAAATVLVYALFLRRFPA